MGKPVSELDGCHYSYTKATTDPHAPKILQHVKIEAELPTHFDLFSPMTYWRTDTNAHLNKNIYFICHVSVWLWITDNVIFSHVSLQMRQTIKMEAKFHFFFFEVPCDILQNSSTVTWNLFINLLTL